VASETTTANPELLQGQVANLLVQPLEAASVVLSSGVRIFDTASPLRIPKLTSGATVGFVGELPRAGDVGENRPQAVRSRFGDTHDQPTEPTP
jgi:hypothetical protein